MVIMATMGGLLESATAMLSHAERRVEVSAQNLANLTTPGYKRRVSFSELVKAEPAVQNHQNQMPTLSASFDFSSGKQVETGNPGNIAIGGDGFFVVRSGDRLSYTRQGQFERDQEGRLVTPQGLALQARGGGDVVLKSGDFQIVADGTVLQEGEPVARIAIVDFEDRRILFAGEGGTFEAAESDAIDVETPSVRQGVVEASNVSTGDEMVSIMESLRRAESAQRLVNVYDDLMGRALSVFGQA